MSWENGDLERQVRLRTSGRIRDLQIDCLDNLVTVRGWTTSYYVKQLAIQALLEAVGDSEWKPHVDIDVVSAPMSFTTSH